MREEVLQEWRRARQKNQLSRRLRTVSIVAALIFILAVASYLGYHRYRSRFIREAEARLNIDDRSGAVSALRAHVLTNPDDDRSQLRLADLVLRVGDTDSAKRIYRRLIENTDLEVRSSLIHESAIHRLVQLIGVQSDELEGEIEEAIDEKEKEKTIDQCNDLLQLRAESAYLRIAYMGRTFPEEGENHQQKGMESYNLAVALKAYVQWRLGDHGQLESTLDAENHLDLFPDAEREELLGHRRKLLSGYVASYAGDLFSRKEWIEAAQAYATARDHRVLALAGDYDEEVGRLQYSQAAAEYGAGRYWQARELLQELRSKLPEQYSRKRMQDFADQLGGRVRQQTQAPG